MPRLENYLNGVDFQDKNFIGTVTFRNEELTLPDGSKVALGIDGGRWVLVFQEKAGCPFRIFEYNQKDQKVFLDKKIGGETERQRFRKLVKYFLTEANVEDLVTLLPPAV
jgi:hypothetical protein